jgi:Icc-related predicted phosphoesterase
MIEYEMVMVDHEHGTYIDEEMGMQRLTVLAVSDLVESHVYQPSVAEWLGPVDLIVSCGDLPPQYLNFLSDAFNACLYHVLGNHCFGLHDQAENRIVHDFIGATDLHGRIESYPGYGSDEPLLMAGIEGSPLYNFGPHQYTEAEIERKLLKLVPSLLRTKVTRGRYLDLLVTHAPPRGIHDLPDRAHRGFRAFLPFLKVFRPTLMLHGHTHRHNPMQPSRTQYKDTTIINVYGHAVLHLKYASQTRRWVLVDRADAETQRKLRRDA